MDLRSEEYKDAIEKSRKNDYGIVDNGLKLRIAKAKLTPSEHNVLIVIEVGISRQYAKTKYKYYVSMTHREIMEAIGAKSKGVISKALSSLVNKRIIIAQENGKGSFYYGFNPGEWDTDLEKFYDMYDDIKEEMENNMKKGEMDWQDVDQPKRLKKKDKTKVGNWTLNDFGKYIGVEYKKSLEANGYVVSSNTFRTYASRIRNMNFSEIISDLFEMSGDVYHPLMLKAYIDWFADKRLIDVFNDKKFISIKLLRDKKFMKDFLLDHNVYEKGLSEDEIKSIFCNYELSSNKPQEEVRVLKISLEELDSCSDLGLTRFMERYGIVLACNYLHSKKGQSESKILSSLDRFFNKMDVKNLFHRESVENIIDNTFKHCPYRDDMILLDWQKRFKVLSKFSEKYKKKMMIRPADQDVVYKFIVE